MVRTWHTYTLNGILGNKDYGFFAMNLDVQELEARALNRTQSQSERAAPSFFRPQITRRSVIFQKDIYAIQVTGLVALYGDEMGARTGYDGHIRSDGGSGRRGESGNHPDAACYLLSPPPLECLTLAKVFRGRLRQLQLFQIPRSHTGSPGIVQRVCPEPQLTVAPTTLRPD